MKMSECEPRDGKIENLKDKYDHGSSGINNQFIKQVVSDPEISSNIDNIDGKSYAKISESSRTSEEREYNFVN